MSEAISNPQDISLTPHEKAKREFCEDWPTAKLTLQSLQNLVKNPIAKLGIGIGISAGDAIFGTICSV